MKIVEDNPQRRKADLPGVGNPTLESLERYWRALRHAQSVPSRNDIEPSQIDAALPHAFILQRVAPGIARMRVAGQSLHDLLKMDARGMPLSTFFDPSARDEIAKLVEAAFSEPAIISVPLNSQGSLIRSHLTGTMLLLPLRDDKGETTRILGAIVTEGEAGSRPRRFEITKGARIRHETLGLQLASVQPLVHKSPEPATERKAPFLRLVVNNG
ncbi:PAS domain-containing protein [Yoonia sediminilitoris]|uniref:PAS domain-containing protein n=1 Tax=Yoonia sediminilitoris TaxID=1286148 RepID=A0A2T6KS71_9RHOB|nr:PAS domain-containing protein [Yoonia sediminilitoris]PUB19401.1 PAS domain-containing protein [Yoonia sediminilitoris]RCW99569.1 PAS domain-containing protein [Yoonia sediminilitoris]